jgi:competence protein ComEC
MAISGLHIGMIAMALWYLGLVPGWIACVCGRSINSHGIARVMAAFGAMAYALLAGFTLPTVRAVCMVLVVLILGRYHRYINRSGILGFALLWVVLTDPLAILSVGFWLSFAAVALLYLCLTSRLSTEAGTGQKLLQWLWRPVRAQWVLGLGLALPMCLFFGQVSLVAPVANLLAVPIFTFLILPAALSGAALSLVFPFVAANFLKLASAGFELLLAILRGLDQRPFSLWETGAMPIGFLLAVAAGSLLLLLPRPLAASRTGLALVALGITLNYGNKPAIVSVRVLDVGQGLAVLVQTSAHSLLYDAGPAWPGGDAGQQVLIPAFRRVGIRDIDVMMISHGDNDHRGGAMSVLNAFHVRQIIGPPGLQVNKQSVVECQSGTRWQWDGVWFEIIHPRTRTGWSDNNASCVLQISVDGRSLVLLGDIEATAEIVLLARDEIIPADVVIAPHHGSTTSSTENLVNYLSPSYVVFAAGYKNRWDFPSSLVLQRWENAGACNLTTSVTGALEFNFEPDHGFVLSKTAANSWQRPWPVRSITVPDCAQPAATINGSKRRL